jgi:hypothetical protein
MLPAQPVPGKSVEHTVKLTPIAPIGERSATIVAPGNGLQNFNVYYIDTRDFEQGGLLTIDIQILPNSVTDGSFDLFPANLPLPTRGPPRGSLTGSYNVRRGTSTRLEYHFARGQVFALGLEGTWLSPKGATGIVRFRATVHR